jgi:hypothetical protein
VPFFIEDVDGDRNRAGPAAVTRVADDPKKPGASAASRERAEVLERPQRRVLHDVVRVVLIPHQPSCQPACRNEMRHDDLIETRVCRVVCFRVHEVSLAAERRVDHRQRSYGTRTAPGRRPCNGTGGEYLALGSGLHSRQRKGQPSPAARRARRSRRDTCATQLSPGPIDPTTCIVDGGVVVLNG